MNPTTPAQELFTIWSWAWRKGVAQNLLSSHICIVTRVDFEGAIIRPQVGRYTDAGNAALVDLCMLISLILPRLILNMLYHLSGLSPGNRKFQVRIFLPVSEEQWIPCKELVVDFSERCDRAGTRVAM